MRSRNRTNNRFSVPGGRQAAEPRSGLTYNTSEGRNVTEEYRNHLQFVLGYLQREDYEGLKKFFEIPTGQGENMVPSFSQFANHRRDQYLEAYENTNDAPKYTIRSENSFFPNKRLSNLRSDLNLLLNTPPNRKVLQKCIVNVKELIKIHKRKVRQKVRSIIIS